MSDYDYLKKQEIEETLKIENNENHCLLPHKMTFLTEDTGTFA